MSDVFFAFLTDKMYEVQDFLHKTGYKEVFMNVYGMFCKKNDIFRSVCIDKITNIITQQYDGNVYIELESNVYLGKKNYYKPDIAVYKGYTEDVYNNYYDVYLSNPDPTLLIEFVDLNDEMYAKNVISVYKETDVLDCNTIVLFVDLVKKELYKYANYMDNNANDISAYNHNEISYLCTSNYLQKLDYYNDLQFDDLIINFDTMLTCKKCQNKI